MHADTADRPSIHTPYMHAVACWRQVSELSSLAPKNPLKSPLLFGDWKVRPACLHPGSGRVFSTLAIRSRMRPAARCTALYGTLARHAAAALAFAALKCAYRIISSSTPNRVALTTGRHTHLAMPAMPDNAGPAHAAWCVPRRPPRPTQVLYASKASAVGGPLRSLVGTTVFPGQNARQVRHAACSGDRAQPRSSNGSGRRFVRRLCRHVCLACWDTLHDSSTTRAPGAQEPRRHTGNSRPAAFPSLVCTAWLHSP